MVEAIQGSVVDSADSAVGNEMEALNKSWTEVKRLSELRDARLQEALVLVCTLEN